MKPQYYQLENEDGTMVWGYPNPKQSRSDRSICLFPKDSPTGEKLRLGLQEAIHVTGHYDLKAVDYEDENDGTPRRSYRQ